MQISSKKALTNFDHSPPLFFELLRNQAVTVEIYKRVKEDHQKPHSKDEIYIIINGTGSFYLEGIQYEFGPHDFFFVPAGKVHRFEEFTDDFSTWVIFLNEGHEHKKLNEANRNM